MGNRPEWAVGIPGQWTSLGGAAGHCRGWALPSPCPQRMEKEEKPWKKDTE